MLKEMAVADLKLYTINFLSLAVVSMTNIEPIFEIALLVVTIGYTVNKWWNLKQRKKNDK
jgi:hypothetical protein